MKTLLLFLGAVLAINEASPFSISQRSHEDGSASFRRPGFVALFGKKAYPLWPARIRKNSHPLSDAEAYNNMQVMTQLATGIIGDLRGLLSEMKSEENVHRNGQEELEATLERALGQASIDPSDPDRLLRLS